MERITRFRATVVILLFCVVLAFFAIKLFDVQIVETQGSKDNQSTYTTLTRVKAARGDILDRYGNVLVSNRASYDLVINNYVLLSADGTNNHLLRLVQLCREQGFPYIEHFPVSKTRPYTYTLEELDSDYQTYFQSFLASRGNLDSDITAQLLMRRLRESYGIPDDWSDEDARAVIGLRYELALRSDITPLPTYVFLEDATEEELADVLELNIPGLTVETTTVREYNTTYAAHILGYVGSMSPEQWEVYQNQGYTMDAAVGRDGLEEAFEEYLHGTDGWRVDEVTQDGTLVNSYYQTEPHAGSNVQITIDLNLQMVAEDALATVMRNLRNSANPNADGADAEGAAAVVMDVKTGEVLACASYPTYDPSSFFENYKEIESAEFHPLINRALQMTYPPGSTFKMCMAIAGIEYGGYSQYSVIEDQGVYNKYDDFQAYCLSYSSDGTTHGSIDMRQALQVSCNYYFYVVGDSMQIDDIDRVAKGLGLGEATGVELSEQIGRRANPENKWDLYMGSDAEWYRADQVMASIGQSINAFTPMQLCSYTCTLANRGTRYKATFLNRVVSSDYQQLLLESTPEILSTMRISDEAYAAYTTGMKMVANEPGGTAYSTFGSYPVVVAAKTGTAETGTTGSDNGAFVCYAPADDPQIAIAVYGEKAGHGSTLSQVAKAILDAYFADESGRTVVTGENRLG